MQDSLTIHHTSLSAAERSRLVELNERLSRYFRSIFTVRWVISGTAKLHDIRLQVHARSGYYHAQTQGERIGQCIDNAFDRIVRQRRRTRATALTARSRKGIAAKHAMMGLADTPTSA